MPKTALEKGNRNTTKEEQLYGAALGMLATSLRFGIEEEVYKSVALYNIKAFDLCRFDGKSFPEFVESLHLSATSAKRFVRIGRAFSLEVNPHSETPMFLMASHLESFSKRLAERSSNVTLRGLDVASRDLKTFRDYIDGKITDEQLSFMGSSARSLPLPEPENAGPSTEQPSSIRTQSIIESKTASDESLAIEFWNRLENKLERLTSEFSNELLLYGKKYSEWFPEANPRAKEIVTERFRALSTRLTNTVHAVSAIYRGDLDEAQSTLQSHDHE